MMIQGEERIFGMRRSGMERIFGAAVSAAFLCGLGAAAFAQATPTQVGNFRNWNTYTVGEAKTKQCYIAAQPSDMQPKGVNRDPVFFLVTARPADKVKNEASVVIGYPLKEDSKVSIEIGTQKFTMNTKDDGAWFETAAQEDELVDALRKGATMVVKGTSKRGTNTTDTYQLAGATAALGKMAEACK
jgi:hypothetical protein